MSKEPAGFQAMMIFIMLYYHPPALVKDNILPDFKKYLNKTDGITIMRSFVIASKRRQSLWWTDSFSPLLSV